MLQTVVCALLLFLSSFFIEGVSGLDPTPMLVRRQDRFTPTTDASSPTSSPVIVLNDFSSSLTTCSPTNVTWLYAGPPLLFELVARSIGGSQDPPSPSFSPLPTNTLTDDGVRARSVPGGASEPAPTTVVIGENVNPQASAIPWNVNLPSGWYQIYATIQSVDQDHTDPFFVQAGSDVSCLLLSPPSTSTKGGPMSASSTMPGETAVPTTPASKDTRVGVIVGVVAGAVVFLIIVLMAYLWLRRRKNSLDKPVGGHSSGGKLNRGWGNLGSRNSISQNPDRRSRASRDLTPATRSAGNHHLATAPPGTGFAEDDENFRTSNSTPFSPSVEKLSNSPGLYTNPFDDAEGGLALATLPSTGGNPFPPSRCSSQQGVLSLSHAQCSSVDSFTYHHEPPSVHRKNSSVDVSSYLQSSYSSSPLAEAELVRSYSVSSSARPPSTDISHQQQKQVHRQSAGSQSNQAKKMPRKPVPTFDSSSIPVASSYTSGSSELSTSYVPSPATPLTPTSPILGSLAQGHYSTKSQQSGSGSGSGNGSNNLAHKSSFGPGGVEGKPIHYLIPDMPPPTKR